MRNRRAYLAAKRSDPYDPAQMVEHPYDFVTLPERAARGHAVSHEAVPADRLSGVLRLRYRLESPLHVGSGVFESAAECGLAGGARPVRGILRSRGRPVLPGSSWKGAVRARFEAITASRLAIVGTTAKEESFKVPGPLRQGGGKHLFTIVDRRVVPALAPQSIVRDARELPALSPADALFGCMGYRGRLHPREGAIDGAAASKPLRVAPLDSPQAHRLATPSGLRPVARAKYDITEYDITKVEGRKFYYDGAVVESRKIRDRGGHREIFEWIDHVPAGATIAIDVLLYAITEVELGALLVSAGYGEEVGILRFGGYKSVGLGKVRLESARATLGKGLDARRWRRDEGELFDLDRAVERAEQGYLDLARLAELHQVTTRGRPA
ncbi:MAG: hypothetical protein D6696_00140 [Acidobacteria bacterium]|nr:MAG: hypothetical protein D6696_00140 [Acidobacteriota bacterium]